MAALAMQPFETRRVLRGTALSRLEAPVGEVLGTAFARGLETAPGPSGARLGRLNRAQNPDEPSRAERFRQAFPHADVPQRLLDEDAESPAVTRRMSEDEWKASPHFRPGLSYPDGGYTPAAARLIAERFDRRTAQNVVLSRAPAGFAVAAATFGAEIAGNLADPLSIASAFVPVVGEARFAQLVARHGVTGARAIKGGVEGFVGGLALEPLSLAAARVEQDPDYTMATALANLAFGSAFGAGLHVGAGRVGDWLARRRLPVRETAHRKAVADLAEGRPVDVSPVLQPETVTAATPRRRNEPPAPLAGADLAARQAETRARQQRDAARAPRREQAFDPDEVAAEVESRGRQALADASGTLRRLAPEETPTRVVREMGGIRPSADLETLDLRTARPGLVRAAGRSLADVRERFEEVGLLPAGAKDSDAIDLIDAELRGNARTSTETVDNQLALDEARGAVRDAEAAAEARATVAAEVRGMRIGDLSADELDEIAAEAVATGRDPLDLLDDALERRALAGPDGGQAAGDEGDDIPFFDAAPDPDAAVARAAADEIDAADAGDPFAAEILDEEIEIMRASGALNEDDQALLDAGDALVAEAESAGRGYRALAVCMARTA